MPEQLPDVLEPDVDDFCYLFAQAILRLLEEEDGMMHSKQKRSAGSDNQATTEPPVPGVDLQGDAD